MTTCALPPRITDILNLRNAGCILAMQREHIGEDRLEQCAIAATDLTEAENVHLEDCANCWKPGKGLPFAGKPPMDDKLSSRPSD